MSTFTLERLRRDIAHIINEDPETIAPDDNLMDWGLDSLRMLTLVTGWNRDGLDIDMMELAGETTLAGWWDVIEARLAD